MFLIKRRFFICHWKLFAFPDLQLKVQIAIIISNVCYGKFYRCKISHLQNYEYTLLKIKIVIIHETTLLVNYAKFSCKYHKMYYN